MGLSPGPTGDRSGRVGSGSDEDRPLLRQGIVLAFGLAAVLTILSSREWLRDGFSLGPDFERLRIRTVEVPIPPEKRDRKALEASLEEFRRELPPRVTARLRALGVPDSTVAGYEEAVSSFLIPSLRLLGTESLRVQIPRAPLRRFQFPRVRLVEHPPDSALARFQAWLPGATEQLLRECLRPEDSPGK